MGVFKKTTQVQQPQKQLQYVKGNYPGAAPFFFENGNIFYIYRDCLVGTYETGDKEEIWVYDRYGKKIGRVEFDGSMADATLWNISNWYSDKAKEYAGTTIQSHMNSLSSIEYYEKDNNGKGHSMLYVAESYGLSGVHDCNNSEIKYATTNSRDTVGIMAAFICMQAFDPRAPFHNFYTID